MRDNPIYQINLVKIVEKIFPDRKTKYIEHFTRLIREHYQNLSTEDDFRNHISEYNMDDLNPFEQLFLLEIVQNIMEGDEINRWKYFCNKFESNAIKNLDLQTINYIEFAQIIDDQYKIDEQKELEKQIYRLMEDDEWLVLVPLTHESSKKYGANTKWCTTAESIDAYNNYVYDGMLIYIINKKTNVKYAIYYETKDQDSGRSNLTVYDDEDDCVELLFIDVPHTVLSSIRKFLTDYPITTRDLSEKKTLKPFQNEVVERRYFDIETTVPDDLNFDTNKFNAFLRMDDKMFTPEVKALVDKYINYELDKDDHFGQ